MLRPMEREFGLSPAGCLAIDDLFVAKYEPRGQKGLAAHEDGSIWSFVVALNAGDGTAAAADDDDDAIVAEFAGGGTRFELLPGQPVYRPGVGGAIGFHGHNRHCGMPVTRGVRYILAGFLTVSN